MTFPFRSALAVGLLAGTAALLTACDYAPYSPGKNLQAKVGFGSQPHGYTNADINADSINNQQTVTKPIGVGSATAIKNGSVQDKLNSAPGGSSASAMQSASGQPAPADKQPALNGSEGQDMQAKKGSPSE